MNDNKPCHSIFTQIDKKEFRASLKTGIDRARDLRNWERHILQ